MRTIPASELAIHSDGSVFHLHLKPEQLADRVVLVGDPARVTTVASYFESQECEVSSREFHTITGQYKGKRITVVSHGIGTDNIDIVLNELDALANIDFSTRTIKPEFKHPEKAAAVQCGRHREGLIQIEKNQHGASLHAGFLCINGSGTVPKRRRAGSPWGC